MLDPSPNVRCSKIKVAGKAQVPHAKQQGKREKRLDHTKPAYNKRLISSTPLLNASNGDSQFTATENDTVEELIQEREKLQKYLQSITQDKNKIKDTYSTLLQEHNQQAKDSEQSGSKDDTTSNNLLQSEGYFSTSKHSSPHFQAQNNVVEKSPRQLVIQPSNGLDSVPPDANDRSRNIKMTPTSDNETSIKELTNLMASIAKKLTLQKDRPANPDLQVTPIPSKSTENVFPTSFKSKNTDTKVVPSLNYPPNENEHACERSNKENVGGDTPGMRIENFTVRDASLDVSAPAAAQYKRCDHDSEEQKSEHVLSDQLPPKREKTGVTAGTVPKELGIGSVSNNIHLTTLNYLLKELNALLGEKRDLEVNRLLTEIDHAVGMLPFSMNSLPIDVQTEINFALQPLRVDNADLRRKLRLANQKIKELNARLNEQQHDDKNELVKYVEELTHKLTLEENTKKLLTTQIADVCKVSEDLQVENQKILQSISSKDLKYLEDHQLWLNEKSSLQQKIQQEQSRTEELHLSLQTQEKELNILKLSAKQKDAEIDRLSNLNRDLQQSVASLIADIEIERNAKAKRLPSKRILPNDKEDIVKLFVRSTNYKYDQKPSSSNETSDVTLENTTKTNSLSSTTFATSKFDSMYSGTETLSTLATYDNSDFQRDMEHLDEEIERIQKSLKKAKNSI
ncbi:uncharacterized protein LOC130641263 isoform X2 [Hydractinia symbiolongicarpus]|nr:uncharacterized protein LOC130641263 isoform X2 [Hydractinia symbiolongicarpus]XP_057303983.1 uncharacterized protein LOC130641263 isoform X2 [Hydractinia symbiolongicarpus]